MPHPHTRLRGYAGRGMPTGGAAAPMPVTLIEDTFTDTTGVSLDAHTILPTNTPPTSWTEQNGNWEIGSNKARVNANADNSVATCNPGVADCQISALVADTNVGSDTFARSTGIVARYSDTSNYWAITINDVGNKFYIYELNAGSSTARASAAVDIGTGTQYAMVATLSGQTITATLDGANQIQYTSAALNETATVHGMKTRLTTSNIDNFKVET